ncbi:uncharacterized protein METZ01_LOCUS133599, partial [marine metagenome]
SGEFGAITLELRKTLLGIQREEIDDTFGWVYPITN